MKLIELKIIGKYFMNTNNGEYEIELRYKDKIKILTKSNITGIDSEKGVILVGLIDAVQILKEPCLIKVYSSGTWGITRVADKETGMPKTKKYNGDWNRELKNQLRELLIEKNHRMLGVIERVNLTGMAKSMNSEDIESRMVEIMDRANTRKRHKDISVAQINFIVSLYTKVVGKGLTIETLELLKSTDSKAARQLIAFLK